jgi:hypothetical protein
MAFLLAAHQRAEEVARAANVEAADHCPAQPVEFVLASLDLDTAVTRAAEAHIRVWMPSAALHRIAAERKFLVPHEPSWPGGEPEYGHHMETVASAETGRTRYVEVQDEKPVDPYWCEACQVEAPCGAWLGLAAAWGLPCGETTVFWPDVEACDAVCVLPTWHDGDHEDEILGPWGAGS